MCKKATELTEARNTHADAYLRAEAATAEANKAYAKAVEARKTYDESAEAYTKAVAAHVKAKKVNE